MHPANKALLRRLNQKLIECSEVWTNKYSEEGHKCKCRILELVDKKHGGNHVCNCGATRKTNRSKLRGKVFSNLNN